MRDIRFRRAATKRLRNQIILRDMRICRYCGKQIFDDHDLTLDHVVPFSRGGYTEPANLVVSCQACNMLKEDKTVEEAGMKLLSLSYIKRRYKKKFYPASKWITWEYDCGDNYDGGGMWSALYIYLEHGPLLQPVLTIEIEENLTMVDLYGPDEKMWGIEILDPDRNWGLEKIFAKFEFTKEEKKYLRWIKDSKPWHTDPSFLG